MDLKVGSEKTRLELEQIRKCYKRQMQQRQQQLLQQLQQQLQQHQQQQQQKPKEHKDDLETDSLRSKERKDDSNRPLQEQQHQHEQTISQHELKRDESEQKNLKLQEMLKKEWIRRHHKHQQQQQQQQIVAHELTIARLSRELSIAEGNILEQMYEIEELQHSNAKMAREITFGQEKNLWTPE